MRVSIETIMTSAVVCAKPDYSVHDLMQIMDKDDVRCIPIIGDDGRCVGVVSGSDLVRWHKIRKRSSEVPVSQILSDPVVAVAPKLNVMEAVKLMVEKNVHHLIVVEEGQMIGIVSVMDVLKQVVHDASLVQ
jgi:CBS domain-containing protein